MVDLNLPKKRTFSNQAPIWKRVASFVIDLLILQFIVLGPFAGTLQNKLTSGDFQSNYEFLITNPEVINGLSGLFFAIFIFIFAYFVIFEFKLKQTPGKILLNLYLKPVDKDKITFLKVIVRNLAAIPVFPLSILWIVDPCGVGLLFNFIIIY